MQNSKSSASFNYRAQSIANYDILVDSTSTQQLGLDRRDCEDGQTDRPIYEMSSNTSTTGLRTNGDNTALRLGQRVF